MAFSTKTAQFAWKEITIICNGRPLIEATDIEYKVSKNLEEIYGAGDSPQFIGEGNKSFSGSLEVLQSGYEAMITEAKKEGGDDITDYEWEFLVSYVPKKKGAGTVMGKTIVDRVVGVKFSESGKKLSQGGTHFKMSLPFKALNVENQI
jgi:hypothetical protein